jgi:predicted nucleotidyltransferase
MIRAMRESLEAKAAEIAALCAKHRVRRLAVFGSTATGKHAPGSDVDLLVEFGAMTPRQHAESYFGLIEDLHGLLGAPIDLVEKDPIRNPYFRQAVEETQVVLFEAA